MSYNQKIITQLKNELLSKVQNKKNIQVEDVKKFAKQKCNDDPKVKKTFWMA